MIKIINENIIECSVSDTFLLIVEKEEGFASGDTLKFEISNSEETTPFISKEFLLNGDAFNITLTETEREKLKLSNYIYRIIIIGVDGSIITQQSGDFIVKWGA